MYDYIPFLTNTIQFMNQNIQTPFTGYNGICLHPTSKIKTDHNHYSTVDSLKVGDTVISKDGTEFYQIKMVIKMKVHENKLYLVKLNENVTITPNHPVKYLNQWYYAKTFAEPLIYNVDYLYNFVLDSCNLLTTENYSIVTIGHHFTDDIVSHPYFGSQQVIDDLKQFPTDSFGNTLIESYNFEIDYNTNTICGIQMV